MTATRAYKLLLSLPFVVPALAFLALCPLMPEKGPPEGFASVVAFVWIVLFWTTVGLAIPYAVLVIGVLIYTWREPLEVLKRALRISPVYFVGLTWLFGLCFTLLQDEPRHQLNILQAAGALASSAIFVLAFGYTYVGMSYVIVRFLRFVGVVVER